VVRDLRNLKELVRQHWDDEPCGTRGIPYPIGSLAYFETIAERRYRLNPHIAEYAQFDRWESKKVLEVGCGVGSDLLRFAQAGAIVTGIDLSERSVMLAKERFHLYKYDGTILQGDAEDMDFEDGTFDLAYSMGVLHHTPDIQKAIKEIYRVTKAGGEICVMLYHQPSLVALQMWLAFGLLKGKPFRSVDDIFATEHESLGTKAYTVDEARRMFSAFRDLRIDTVVTAYDLRYGRDRYLPMWMIRTVPHGFGWNLMVRGVKP